MKVGLAVQGICQQSFSRKIILELSRAGQTHFRLRGEHLKVSGSNPDTTKQIFFWPSSPIIKFGQGQLWLAHRGA
jgi:hypothetical protein